MVLHIDLFRAEKGSDVNIIYESEKKRYSEKKWADEVIEFDREWRKDLTRVSLDQLQKLSVHHCVEFKKLLEKAIATSNELKISLDAKRQEALRKIGNIVHHSVPVHDDESYNEVIRTFGSGIAPQQKSILIAISLL
ncbi:probable serine--tRNA ligase, cytoplasmic [Zophobas morio]|uniref:probable serine--tRNA ligase, cytoplasmic n=1 Tax=Zophobas morio TaxID=2755281 RepID=UPI0030833FB2